MAAPSHVSPGNGVEIDYRELFGAVPGLFLILDHDLRIVTATEAYCQATLTDLNTIRGRSLFEVFPDNPDDPNADGVRNLSASLDRVLQLKRPDAMAVQKYDVRNAQGAFEERYWSPINVPLLVNGEVRLIMHRAEDVTALMQLKAEGEARDQVARDQQQVINELRNANFKLAATLEENARLQASKLYLASIVESSGDAILSVDLGGIISSWNKAAERMFGYTAAQIIGRDNTMLFPPHRYQEEEEILTRIKRGEVIPHYETFRLHKNGSTLQVSVTASPIRDSGGRIIGVSKIAQDISGQKRAEARMKALEADRLYMADIVDNSNDAIIARSLDGKIASWNRAAERMYGYRAEDVIGRPASELSPSLLSGDSDDIAARLERGETVTQYETTRRRANGEEFPVSISASLIRNAAGDVTGASAIVRDITERRRAEEKLRSQQAELIHLSRWNTMGMMASTIAHELNQPLTAAMNYVRAGRRTLAGSSDGPPPVEKVGEFLDKAVEEVKLAGGIIRSLREFIDKRETSRATEDINHVVQEALGLSLAGGPDARLKLQVTLAPGLAPVLIDKIQIEQVLLNLVRNAMEAMQALPDGRIAVSTGPDEAGFVRVSVADNGPGIAPDVMRQLFQPFVTTKEKGMGIGLTICQSIIESHGGRIWTEVGQPQGVTFHFRLPLQEGGDG